jgi:hypothetical protein
MQRIEPFDSPANSLRRFDSIAGLLRSLADRFASSMGFLKLRANSSQSKSEPANVLKVAGYTLVLMDSDGQVVWTREWDAGGVFEFRPRQRLLISCSFTNYSASEAEVSEYEIELMSEDGLIVKRFNDSFGDSVIVSPGESKHFPAEWRM